MRLISQTDEFQNREQAGRLLAARLSALSREALENTVLLALPRGGVPIAFEVARELDLPLSVLIVRKIGAPHHAEYGIGAVTEEGYAWIDRDAARLVGADDQYLLETTGRLRAEIDSRRDLYRHGRALPPLENKTVILIDDGLATGVTARVAARFVRTKNPRRLLLAVPVCARDTVSDLKAEVDDVICLRTPRPFYSVGRYFKNFHQVSNHEVLQLLSKSKGLL